jgi:ketosteroid isomerase-like protein
MSHPNEERLRDLYEKFGKGDIAGFLAGCTEEVRFSVPGDTVVSGTYTKPTFNDLVTRVMERSGGTFREEAVEVVANDRHGVLVLDHSLRRDGIERSYRTSHLVEFANGRISSWLECPGSLTEFEDAWGPR